MGKLKLGLIAGLRENIYETFEDEVHGKINSKKVREIADLFTCSF